MPCWKTAGDVFGARTSYQRRPTDVPATTLWVTTSASWSPKLRYARRYIRRSASESSFWVVPDCGMHVPLVPHALVKAATPPTGIDPVSVEDAGVTQST